MQRLRAWWSTLRWLQGLLVGALIVLGLLWATRQPQTSKKGSESGVTVRVGYFPNVNHAQALVGQATQWFDRRVEAPMEWKAFHAGPTAMEALLAGAIDLSYVGPNPAVNAYVRSKGQALRIVAGAASGGASLVVRSGAEIQAASDFLGKRVASPEIGNTQDVALRHWLNTQGLEAGKALQVFAVKNPDIVTLFQRKELDAAWVPEPWATRLLQEADGRLFLDERDLWQARQFPTAVLVVRTAFLRQHPAIVKQFVQAHQELTVWIADHPQEARTALNDVLARVAGKPLPSRVLEEALTRLDITYDPIPDALVTAAKRASALGYLPAAADRLGNLGGLFDLTWLNEVLREHGKEPIIAPSNGSGR
ncbi:MAG: ABC transporter substrate-binding protein [Candidatus Omnitrophica bacterium]|nr:ABC transporter substrate-binding protein [Candidatus Omnitrophota bacterium]